MKKRIALILCILMIFALAACSDKKASDDKDSAAAQDATEVKNDVVVDNNITDTNEMIYVETSIGNLYYPTKWAEDVSFDVSIDQVDASCGDVELFTIYFGGKKGDLYGVLTKDKKTELRYEMYEIDADAEDADDLCAMQDDINVIFQYLIQEGKLEESI